eukprot:11215203-Lingulodinium_polyedra.AAC.1
MMMMLLLTTTTATRARVWPRSGCRRIDKEKQFRIYTFRYGFCVPCRALPSALDLGPTAVVPDIV